MEIPNDLEQLVRLRFDSEVQQIGPPEHIFDEVTAVMNGAEATETLQLWIATQRDLHRQAAHHLTRLWAAHGDLSNGLPGWFALDWAYALHFPWSRNLAKAVEQAEQWV